MAYRKAVTVSLPPPLLQDVERLAKKQHQTTSELVRAALHRYLEDRKTEQTLWKRLRAYGAKKAAALGARSPDEVEALVNRIVAEYRQEARAAHAAPSRR